MQVDADVDVQAFAQMVARSVGDPGRLAAVADAALLDTEPETSFDRVAAIAARLLDTPFAFITVVDDTRSYWKACIGIESTDPADRQNSVQESFCQYVIGLGDELLVDDTRLDPRTSGNPSIESMGVLAWAGVPLRAPGGEVLGTVCVVDTQPRAWSRADAQLLHELAAIAAENVEARRAAGATVRAENLLHAVLERAPIGFGLLNDDLEFEIANSTMAALTGRPAGEVIGQTISEVLPDMSEALTPLIENVFATAEPMPSHEVTGRTDADPLRDCIWSANCYRLDLGDGELRAGLIVEDVTGRATSARRATRLAGIAGQLAAVSSLADVSEIIGTALPPYLGAVVAAAGVIDASDNSIVLLGAASDLLDESDVSGAEKTHYGAAFRENRMVLVSDRASRYAEYDVLVDLDLEAVAAVPCRNSAGQPIGVFVMGWAEPMQPEEFPVDQLSTVADILGLALERIRVTHDQRELVDVLQRTLLDPAPTAANFDVAARYSPAASALGFGGDWYDVIELSPVKSAFVVGDVVGHDPTAAARMAEIRTVIRDLVKLGVELDTIFDKAEDLLGDGHASATVAITVLDLSSRTMHLVRAGHLPVLVREESGETRLVDGALRPPLGVGGPPLVVEAADFPLGATLVAVTDGLIETRGSTITDDLRRLQQAVAALDQTSVDDMSDSLVERFVPDAGWSDDVAIIVARQRQPDPVHAPTSG